MDIIDKILERICDPRWYSIEELKTTLSLPSDKLNDVLCFLEIQELINIEKEKIKITHLGHKFLALKS